MTAPESGRQVSAYVTIGGAVAFSLFSAWYANRIRRSRWLEEEERTHGHEATHSVIDHFKVRRCRKDVWVHLAARSHYYFVPYLAEIFIDRRHCQ